MPPPTQPVWLAEARTRGVVEFGINWAEELVRQQLTPGQRPEKQDAKGQQPLKLPSYQMPAAGTDSRPQNGYKTEERRGIESLIQDQDKP
jgi:hypothetical protein